MQGQHCHRAPLEGECGEGGRRLGTGACRAHDGGRSLEDIARQLLTDLVLQFKATMDELGNVKIDAAERVALLTSLSDSYNKAISANRKLLPETSRLATALEVINRLADYLKLKRPDLLGGFLEVLEDFGAELERELK